MTKSLLFFAFIALIDISAFAQCNATVTINQLPVNCSDQQLTFMGYATSDCPFGYMFQYTWMAYVQGANGSQTAIPELTYTGEAISGTTFEQYSIPLNAYPYVQVCLQLNVVDDLGAIQAQTMSCQSAINFPQPIVVTASVGLNNCGQPSCLAQFGATGGTPPYAYLVSNGQVISPGTWNCFDVPGVYVLTAVDANGCEGSTSFTIQGGQTDNATCETAQPLENGVILNDTLCTFNFDEPACSNGLSFFQSGWYSFNSENFSHANIAFYSGYDANTGGAGGFNPPTAIQVFQADANGSCAGAELVYCQSYDSNSSTGADTSPCFDLADSVAIQPNTTYFIKFLTMWTTWVPVQAVVMLTNEPIAPLCGCTINTSCNYDPEALIPDGSCGYSGCMDEGACNYQQWATCDNGSCIYGRNINGVVFHDVNGDGIQQTAQPAEPVLSNIGVITIEELGVLIYPDASGQFVLPNVPQATYTISFEDPNGHWMLNADNELTVTLPTCNGLKLPLIPASQTMAQVSGVSIWENSTIHCVAGFNPGIYIYNNGNLPLNGTFVMNFDASLTYTEAPWAGTGVTVEAPTQTSAGTLTWTIDNQPAGSLYYYQVHINGPGAATAGQSFPFSFALSLLDASGGEFYDNLWTINPTVTCSYDPNDKQATPAGWTEQHFITAGEEIEYRIRFQNTGNAPAFNVRIEDQLDLSKLNLNTFNPIAASHSYSTIVTPDGMVQFVFDNIMLPDSVHDEANSHGWVVYRIRSFDSLLPLNVINNTAAIYFDDNEPVITNTYSHTIFSCDLIPDPNGVNATCEGQSVLLNIFPELDYTETYAWYVNGTQVGNEIMYEFPADASGNYNIVLNRTNPFCNVLDTLNVEVWPVPDTTAVNNFGILVAPNGQSWDWLVGGQSIGWNEQEFIPMEAGAYYVITTNEFGCTSLSNEIIWVIGSVEEASTDRMQVYPNPTHAMVNFTIPNGFRGVRIFNASGQLVHANESTSGAQQLDLTGWSPGMYRMEVQGLSGVTLIIK
ncbi:MAG: hypothetical protein RL040_1392 [Bacteroidota bacterium]